MIELLSRITIISIGISSTNNGYFPKLQGVEKDITNLRKIFVENPKTAIFTENQFSSALNIDSNKFREIINEYVLSRSAGRDILILYYSGHGIPIGSNDFGFCTTDTIIHPTSEIPLPFSIVRFSEILRSLETVDVIPIFIIDACYSGKAAKQMTIPSLETISNMRNQIHSVAASSYALFCSCSDYQVSIDTQEGGVFSNSIMSIGKKGVKKKKNNKPILSIKDLFPLIEENVLSEVTNSVPRLFIGQTVPDLPFIKNAQYKPRQYSLCPTLIQVIKALWNNGENLILTPQEIGKICSHGAYCNHNKLSEKPWGLVETVPNSYKRKLTSRGIRFSQNKISIPKIIIEDTSTGEFVPKDDTRFVKISDFQGC
jgi:hypothetical protein